MSVSICLSVCLFAPISQKLHVQTSWNFLYSLPFYLSVARSSYDDNAICYVLPVLWTTSRLPIIGQAKARPICRILSESPGAAPGVTSYVYYDCLVIWKSHASHAMVHERITSYTMLYVDIISTCRPSGSSSFNTTSCSIWRRWSREITLRLRHLDIGHSTTWQKSSTSLPRKAHVTTALWRKPNGIFIKQTKINILIILYDHQSMSISDSV